MRLAATVLALAVGLTQGGDATEKHALDFAARLASAAAAAHRERRFDEAERLWLRVLQIHERLAPGSPGLAQAAHQLGNLALDRGDAQAAEAHYRRALEAHDQLGSDTADLALVLHYLAEIEMQRVDLDAAEPLYQRALEIQERLSPGSLDLAQTYEGLGAAARLRSDRVRAEAWLAQALEIRERRDLSGRAVLATLAELATVSLDRGDVAAAQRWLERAGQVGRSAGFDSIPGAAILSVQGQVEWLLDRPREAEAALLRALETWSRHAPGSLSEADAMYALGWTYRQRGRHDQAAEHLCRLVDVVEADKLTLGGSEDARARLAANLTDYTNECIEVLVDLGRGEEAFRILEQARARRLLELLAEREIAAPPEAAALEARAAQLRKENDGVHARLWRLEADATAQEAEALHRRLRALRVEADRVASAIRQKSPRLGALRYPQPLDVAGARTGLDPGTLLLSYSVAAGETFLFAVSADAFTVHRLPVGRDALRARVRRFRAHLERGDLATRGPATLAEEGRALHRDLLAPVAPRVASARRLLLCLDGPLLALPFAALVVPADGPDPVYLAQRKPTHTVASATVYAELRRGRDPHASFARELVAFGDPIYPALGAGSERAGALRDAELRSAVARGLSLTALPGTRQEVENLRRLYPEAVVYLGAQATEERAKQAGRGTRYLHFACHGLLDEVMPLNSGLALTLPDPPREGQDNGLLQAWEIIESVRLDAELVTLSACSSGAGAEVPGEGLVGLTRAFHYAGARSVVASLWSVSDASAAELMAAFYGALRAGAAKDEALAVAQRNLIAGERFSHPFHWAAFQLSGDWR